MTKIFLKQNASKRSSKVDNFMNVELSTNSRLLPVNEVADTINAQEEYTREKDNSNKYRLIFTINPICTNVLFNAYSEIVYHEGGEDCVVVTENGVEGEISGITGLSKYKNSTRQNLNKKICIQDTAYSDESIGPFVYHCGMDIFNNHLLRKKEFVVVNKIKEGATEANFNTLSDYLRDFNGENVKEKILKMKKGNTQLSKEAVGLHLYRRDSVDSFNKTANLKIKEENGWWGFINPVTLNVANFKVDEDSEIAINKCMNNNKADEFIDMYPDRSLYSFIPKYNKFRNRMENNWDYCITYPYSSVTNNTLVESTKLKVKDSNGIRCYGIEEQNFGGTILEDTTFDESGLIYLRSQIKNTFTAGSFINITIFNNGTYYTSDTPIKVMGIGYLGKDTNHIFSIKLMDFYMIISMVGNAFLDGEKQLLSNYEIRVRKYEGGTNCRYYIRKFRKLPNFKDSDVSLEEEVSEKDITDNQKPFNSSLNKMAYGENIFSDKVAQIVFNDDVITSGLRDNLGRELSEIYLTIVKRNKGHKKWYEDGDYTNPDIEFSHCFGSISSGFDLSKEEDDYNIHKISKDAKFAKLSDDITIDTDEFDGDIVEFSPYTLQETVLEQVYFRFNTAQREYKTSVFGRGIKYDEIISDDYDIDNGFATKEYIFDNNSNIHINHEGYYYQPHYRVCTKEFRREVNQGEHQKMTINNIKKLSSGVYSGTTAINYFLNAGDEIYFYKKYTHDKKIGKITDVKGDLYTEITFSINGIDDFSDYLIYKPNPLKPKGAYELEDGTGRYLWREKKSDQDMLPNDELYNSTFTNGAHYRHQNITLFLRRQDPTNEFGLSTEDELFIDGEITDVSTAEYINEGEGAIC